MEKYRKKSDYYESLDKRTREYKNYKKWKDAFEEEQSGKPEGLGDVVEKITKATGIKAVVDFFTPDGKDCGCDKRKKELNKIFNFNKPKCLEEDEYTFLSDFIKRRKFSVSNDDLERLYEINNRVFSQKLKKSSCPSCIRNIIRKFEAILKTYK